MRLWTAKRLALVSVLALGVAPAAAHAAEPYWTSNGKVIAEGVKETVKTSAAVGISLGTVGVLKCKLTDEEIIENPSGGAGGIDTLNTFTFTGCAGKVSGCSSSTDTIVSKGSPWATELLPGPPIRDRITGLELEVKCGLTTVGVYSGELRPEVTTSSSLEFGPGAGALTAGLKTLEINGADKMTGPAGDTKIGAEVVEHEPHWYSDGKRIAEGVPETVKTSGTLVLHTSDFRTVTCPIADTEIIENPSGGAAGIDEITMYSVDKLCKIAPACPTGTKLLVQAEPTSLPWSSELVDVPPIVDEITGIAIEVICKGTGGSSVTYSGTLSPEVLATSGLGFSATSGTLSGTNSTTATMSGTDKLNGPTGDTKVTALDP